MRIFLVSTVFMSMIATEPLHGADQPTIRSEADLPPARFPLDEPPSKAFLEPAFLAITLPAIRAEAERVLHVYRIDDPVIAARLRNGVGQIAMLQGRPLDAQRLFAEQRTAETKPRARALGQAKLDAVAAGLAAPPAKRCDASAARMAALLAAADPAQVYPEVVAIGAALQLDSPNYHGGTLADTVDDQFARTHSVDLLGAVAMVRFRAQALLVPPCRDALAAVTQHWIDDPTHRPHDIWRAREAIAPANAAPVVVTVWDGGLDESQFPGQMATDPAEPLDGRDNDGNGVADDIHGPTYTAQLVPNRGTLDPVPAGLRDSLALQTVLGKGERDLDFGHATPEAGFFAGWAREATPDEQRRELAFVHEEGARNHGTAVASLIADDAPFVRVYNMRALPFAIDRSGRRSGMAEFERFANLVGPLLARARGAGVRIANISWGLSEQELVDVQMEHGGENDLPAARARARRLHARIAEALRRGMAASPDILFVLGAGNSDSSDDILGFVPQTLHLPNMIVVGGADISGNPASFTTYGKSVDVYAQGEDIAIRLAGGQRVHGRGTSYSAPLVARAAAFMLAANPRLSPTELVAGIKATATPGIDGMLLVHPAHAVDWARQRKG